MRAGPWKLEASLLLLSLTLAGAASTDTNVTPRAAAPRHRTQRTRTVSHPAPKAKRKAIYLTPHVAEILRLAKAGIADEVVIAYIQKSAWDYIVTPHQLISLRDAGLSTPVLKALVEHGPKLNPVPPWLSGQGRIPGYEPAGANLGLPAGPLVPWSDYNRFYAMLGAVGQWMFVPGYGWCWQPVTPTADQLAGTGGYLFPGSDLAWSPPIWVSASAWSDLGFGGFGDFHHGHRDHDHDDSMASGSTPWLARNQFGNAGMGMLPAMTTMPSAANPAMPMPFAPVGAGAPPANGGANPFLPVGGQPSSGTAPPFGIAGVPITPNNGNFPYLPVGGHPATGTAPPYGIAGVPVPPNNGMFPFLPVGGQPASGNLNPFGIPPSSPNMGGASFFPQPFPAGPGGPFWFAQNHPPFQPPFRGGSWPLWPSWPTLPHSGFGGGGFHGSFGGGMHGGGGGGHGGR